MNPSEPEPGFVQAYRLFVVTRILFWLVVGPILIVLQMADATAGAPPAAGHSADLVTRFSVPNVLPVLGVDLFLLALLLVPRVQHRLGAWFVPVTLVVGLVPLLIGYSWWPTDNPLQTPFVMFFFVMVVLIAWEYQYRYVLGYVLGLSLFEVFVSEWPAQVPWTVPMGWLVLQGAMMLLVGYVTATLVFVQREQRTALAEAYEQQAAANERLQRYAFTMEELAISRERNRLARELHDTLAHSLSAVTVQLEAVRSLWTTHPERAHHLLEQADATARTGLTEARRALQALRASPLDDLGLVLAVRELAETAAQRCGAALELELPERIQKPVSPAVEQGVYRITQETLENVVRHAGARTIRVRLEQKQDRLQLTVQDDGQGIDRDLLPEPAEDLDDRLGIRGMRERAGLIGGRLAIDSQVGQGTTVRLTVQL
jgi:signal transduction histidine kinase